jgi:hypothetical protein
MLFSQTSIPDLHQITLKKRHPEVTKELIATLTRNADTQR